MTLLKSIQTFSSDVSLRRYLHQQWCVNMNNLILFLWSCSLFLCPQIFVADFSKFLLCDDNGYACNVILIALLYESKCAVLIHQLWFTHNVCDIYLSLFWLFAGSGWLNSPLKKCPIVSACDGNQSLHLMLLSYLCLWCWCSQLYVRMCLRESKRERFHTL